MDEPKVIVDTNILFSFLVSGRASRRKRLLTQPGGIWYCPRQILVELFKHKERIAAASSLSGDDLLSCLSEALARVRFIDESIIPIGTWMEARRLCGDVDPKDTPFVALALHLEGTLWTDDEALKSGLEAKGFNSFFVE